jgi:hypothetical protein
MDRRRIKGRMKLLLLALVFLGPLALSFILYYFVDGWRPKGSTENGILLTPALLTDTPLIPVDNPPRFRGKWSMVYLGEGACDQVCQKALYESRQIRRSLGKEMERVQRIYITTGSPADNSIIEKEHPDLIVVTEPSKGTTELINAIGEPLSGDTFLVDPIGNLMMRFPAGIGMKSIKQDMVHLLKISRIG